jgi:hypothetical protein
MIISIRSQNLHALSKFISSKLIWSVVGPVTPRNFQHSDSYNIKTHNNLIKHSNYFIWKLMAPICYQLLYSIKLAYFHQPPTRTTK